MNKEDFAINLWKNGYTKLTEKFIKTLQAKIYRK